MLRWAGRTSIRILQFWLLWTVMLCGLLDASQEMAPGTYLRLTLLISTTVLLFAEWWRTDREILRCNAALRRCAEPSAERAERKVFRILPVGALAGFWLVVSCARVVVRDTVTLDFFSAWTLLALAFVMALWSLMPVALFARGITWRRTQRALQALPAETRPETTAVVPWTVALLSAPGLLVGFFGLPDGGLLLASLDLLSSPPSARTGQDVEFLVELGQDDTISELAPVLVGFDAYAEQAHPSVSAFQDNDLSQTYRVTVDSDRAIGLALVLRLDRENVDAVTLNSALSGPDDRSGGACRPGRAGTGPTLDPDAPAQIGLERSEAYLLLEQTGRHEVLVAVIDTGIDGSHPDLRQVMWPYPVDNSGGHLHGTQVAGVVAATPNNGTAIGSPNSGGVRIASYPAFPQATIEDIADAIIDAVDDGAAVLNLSFGGRGTSPAPIRNAIEYAQAEDRLVVAAAGNDGPTANVDDAWPANVPGVLAVTGTSRSGGAWSESTRAWPGSRVVTVSALAEDVCTTNVGGGTGEVSGTSVAVPRVSGVAAAIRSDCPAASAVQVRDAIVATAAPVDGRVGPELRAGRAHTALQRQGLCR